MATRPDRARRGPAPPPRARRGRPPPRPPNRRAGRLAALSVCILAVALFVTSAPAMIVLLVGMVPTMVAFFVDSEPRKYAAMTVAATNFAGVTPFLIDLLAGAPTLAQAADLLTNVFALAVMYGAAGAGWVLVLAMPPLTAICLRVSTEAKIVRLKTAQDQLIEEWTDGVAR